MVAGRTLDDALASQVVALVAAGCVAAFVLAWMTNHRARRYDTKFEAMLNELSTEQIQHQLLMCQDSETITRLHQHLSERAIR